MDQMQGSHSGDYSLFNVFYVRQNVSGDFFNVLYVHKFTYKCTQHNGLMEFMTASKLTYIVISK